jgi:hypothetical protein
VQDWPAAVLVLVLVLVLVFLDFRSRYSS